MVGNWWQVGNKSPKWGHTYLSALHRYWAKEIIVQVSLEWIVQFRADYKIHNNHQVMNFMGDIMDFYIAGLFDDM